MILCKDVLHAWRFVYRKAQIKLYKEISLCYFIIRAWQKMLHHIYFRRRMKCKQKMFWLRSLQEETTSIQKRIIRTLWNSFIDQYMIKKFFNFWTKSYNMTHVLNRIEMHKLFQNQSKWKNYRKDFLSLEKFDTSKISA
jgi:hypothetical protein